MLTAGTGTSGSYNSGGNFVEYPTDRLEQTWWTTNSNHIPPYINIIMWRRTA